MQPVPPQGSFSWSLVAVAGSLVGPGSRETAGVAAADTCRGSGIATTLGAFDLRVPLKLVVRAFDTVFERLGLPAFRPMPVIGRRCHELRITDAGHTWRIMYRLDPDAVVVAEVFSRRRRRLLRR